MKDKPLKEWTYDELINYLTGQAIMSLGAGKSMKTIVAENVHLVNMWTWELAKDKYEK